MKLKKLNLSWIYFLKFVCKILLKNNNLFWNLLKFHILVFGSKILCHFFLVINCSILPKITFLIFWNMFLMELSKLSFVIERTFYYYLFLSVLSNPPAYWNEVSTTHGVLKNQTKVYFNRLVRNGILKFPSS